MLYLTNQLPSTHFKYVHSTLYINIWLNELNIYLPCYHEYAWRKAVYVYLVTNWQQCTAKDLKYKVGTYLVVWLRLFKRRPQSFNQGTPVLESATVLTTTLNWSLSLDGTLQHLLPGRESTRTIQNTLLQTMHNYNLIRISHHHDSI